MSSRATVQRTALQAGFTSLLLALMLSVGVVGPSPAPAPDRAPVERAARELVALARAFRAYNVDTGRWPGVSPGEAGARTLRELTDLRCLGEDVPPTPGWAGPYAVPTAAGARDGLLRDPWGRPYLVRHLPRGPHGEAGGLHLLSAGPDGRLDSGLDDAVATRARGDDLALLVSRLP